MGNFAQEFCECKNCKAMVYREDLHSVNGTDFCTECSDNFQFIFDEFLGVIALPQVSKEEFEKLD